MKLPQNVSSILTYPLFIGKQRDLTPSRIEEEYFIAKNLKIPKEIPKINSDFMMPKCMSHEQDTFIPVKYWFNPGRPVPV